MILTDRVRRACATGVAYALVCSLIAMGQAGSPSTAAPPAKEFPVVLQQKIEAGKTPPGTKVQARLVVATLIQGVVFPRNSEFSGEVVDSVARGPEGASRLSVRIHSVRWRDKSANVEADLTAWIYPTVGSAPQDLSFHPPDEANSPKNWNGGGAYPDPNNPVSQQKFPGRETREASTQADAPASQISKHRVRMRGIEEDSQGNGHIILTSTKFGIKLDKTTTYVLAAR